MQEMYKVETILDKRIDPRTKKLQYFIKWEGYQVGVSTWEPVQHLQYCYDLVQEFERTYGHLPTTSYGTLEPNPIQQSSRKNRKKHDKQNHQLQIKQQIKQQVNHDQDNRPSAIKQEPQRSLRNRVVRKTQKYGLRNQRSSESNEPELDLQSLLKLERQISKRMKSMHKSQNMPSDQSPQQKKPNEHTKKIQKNRQKFPRSKKRIKNRHSLKAIKKQRKEKQKVIDSKIFDDSEQKHQEPIKQALKSTENKEALPKQGSKVIGRLLEQDRHQHVVEAIDGGGEEKVKILGMRRAQEFYEFYLQKGAIEGWSTHRFILQNYPRELCAFYERHIEFD